MSITMFRGFVLVSSDTLSAEQSRNLLRTGYVEHYMLENAVVHRPCYAPRCRLDAAERWPRQYMSNQDPFT